MVFIKRFITPEKWLIPTLVFLFSICHTAAFAGSGDDTWLGTSNTSWSDPANWAGSGPVSGSDTNVLLLGGQANPNSAIDLGGATFTLNQLTGGDNASGVFWGDLNNGTLRFTGESAGISLYNQHFFGGAAASFLQFYCDIIVDAPSLSIYNTSNEIRIHGVMSGDFDLDITGGVAFYFSQAYTGSTHLNDGARLELEVVNALPVTTALTMGTNSTLYVKQNTILGSINGDGYINVTTGRALSLGGDNKDMVFTGTLRGNGGTAIVNKSGTGTLTFDSATVRDMVMNLGSGAIDFTDTTIINTDLNLNTGTRLTGNCKMDFNSFNLADGASFGTTLHRATSGTLSSGQLAAPGTGSLGDNSTIYISSETGSQPLLNNDQFTLASADGGLTVTPDNLILQATGYNTKLLSFALSSDANNLYLNVARQRYASLATTLNSVVATTLDNIMESGSSAMNDVFQGLDTLPDDASLNQALQCLTPNGFFSGSFSARQSMQSANRQMNNYLGQRRTASLQADDRETYASKEDISSYLATSDPSLAMLLAAEILENEAEERSTRQMGMGRYMNIFAKGISSYSNIAGSDSRLGFDSRTHGGVFGLDVRLYPKLVVGLGGSYARTDIDFDDNAGDGEIRSYRFGPYAMLFEQKWFMETSLTLGIHENDFTRNVMGLSPESDYTAVDATANLGGGYDFDLGWLIFTPRASLEYQLYHSEAFTETNGGGANLQVDNYDSHSFTTRLGLDLWQRFELEKIRAITPQVSIGWRREWIDPSSIKSRFSGGGTDFYTNSDHFSTNALTLGAALTSELSDRWNIDFKFDADIGDRHEYTHNISAGLQLKF